MNDSKLGSGKIFRPEAQNPLAPPSAAHRHADHEHHHGHGDHEHHHGQGSQHTAPDPAPILPGAGAGSLLFFDAPSGLAGDMIIASLVDLGVPFEVVESAVAALGLRGFELKLWSAFAGAIGVKRFDVVIAPGGPERSHAEIDSLIAKAGLQPGVSELARAIFLRLARAEARVHRIRVEEVHFHEVGAVDAIVDIVGAAACLAYLGATVVSSPLPMGRGFVECRHGRIPLPAPATVECLNGVPTYSTPLEYELVTPTGAAIIGTVAKSFTHWPDFSPLRVGWGGGTRQLPDRPNALRAILGIPTVPKADAGTYELIEANVDDMTGELAAYVIQALVAAGARDAWVSPITMKKGRPGLMLSAIADSALGSSIASLLLTETTTLGVRRQNFTRLERPRRMLEVETRFGQVRVKVSEGPYGPPQVKPEFEDCAALARSRGVPLREVLAEALERTLALLRGG